MILPKGCADDDADSEINGVTLDREFLEFLQHVAHLIR